MALLIPGTALAQDPSVLDRFERSPIRGAVDPEVLPLGVDDARAINVMLELRGDPVAVVESRAPNRELSRQQRDAIKRELKGRQDALRGPIAEHGGRVLAQYQAAYNGIKVRIARNAVGDLASLPNVIAVRGIQLQTPGNEESVPYIGVPQDVWQDLGLTGDGVKVAVIDTGLDYTHANFGGPGTVEAYEGCGHLRPGRFVQGRGWHGFRRRRLRRRRRSGQPAADASPRP
jgi:minor extracellular serine protease Vpr